MKMFKNKKKKNNFSPKIENESLEHVLQKVLIAEFRKKKNLAGLLKGGSCLLLSAKIGVFSRDVIKKIFFLFK